MTTHGQIDEFHGETEDWPLYMERLERYFADNDVVKSRKQCAILLSCCGGATYSLIQSLASPSKPTAVSYAEW